MIVLIIFLFCALLGILFFYFKGLFFKDCLKNIRGREKEIFLTFDDGPNGDWTKKVLEILERENIKATFFILGKNAEKDIETLKLIESKGHTIANHSYHHFFYLAFLPKSKIEKELKETEKLFKRNNIKFNKLFRPPYGIVSFKLIKVLKSLSYKVICWDVMTNDYKIGKPGSEIAADILKKVKSGSIIVFHDAVAEIDHADRSNLLEALEIVIKTLKKEKYLFSSLK